MSYYLPIIFVRVIFAQLRNLYIRVLTNIAKAEDYSKNAK